MTSKLREDTMGAFPTSGPGFETGDPRMRPSPSGNQNSGSAPGNPLMQRSDMSGGRSPINGARARGPEQHATRMHPSPNSPTNSRLSTTGRGPQHGDPAMNNRQTVNPFDAGRMEEAASGLANLGPGPENGDPKLNQHHKVQKGKNHLATMGPGPSKDPAMNHRRKATTTVRTGATNEGLTPDQQYPTKGPGPRKNIAMDLDNPPVVRGQDYATKGGPGPRPDKRMNPKTLANEAPVGRFNRKDPNYMTKAPGPRTNVAMAVSNPAKQGPGYANAGPGPHPDVRMRRRSDEGDTNFRGFNPPDGNYAHKGPGPNKYRGHVGLNAPNGGAPPEVPAKLERDAPRSFKKIKYGENPQNKPSKLDLQNESKDVHTREQDAGPNYANDRAGGFNKKNPAMDRRVKAFKTHSPNYAYTSAGGWEKENPAMNEQRLAKLQEMKMRMENQLAALRERRNLGEGRLSYLIESELEKAELVLAAKSITEKLQGMAEDLATIGPKELMPIQDSMKVAFGPDSANQFISTTTQQLNALTGALSKAKDAIGTQIAQLESSVNGAGPANDMGMGGGLGSMGNDMSGGPMGGAPGMGGDDLGDLGDDMGGGAMGGAPGGAPGGGPGGGGDALDLGGGGDDMALGGGDTQGMMGGGMGAAGRPRKESYQLNPFSRRLAESRNPDHLVYTAFRRALSECRKPVAAARFVAEKFDIDYGDVVQIVREWHSEKQRLAFEKNRFKKKGEEGDDKDQVNEWHSEKQRLAFEKNRFKKKGAEEKQDEVTEDKGFKLDGKTPKKGKTAERKRPAKREVAEGEVKVQPNKRKSPTIRNREGNVKKK